MNELNLRKQQRQRTLLRLVREKRLTTQQDVVRALRSAGYRDISTEIAPAGEFFYAEAYHSQRVLLLNGRVNNLEYGSNAPDAPQDVFIDDAQFRDRWLSGDRYYVCAEKPQTERFERLVGREQLHTLIESGGKFVFSNQ